MKTSTHTHGHHGADDAPSFLPQARALHAAAILRLERVRWLALLIGRSAVGLLFLSTGWGKVNDLGKVTEFFSSLHIPFPAFHAVLVGYSELVCGAALVIGLLTRLATVPLIVSMIVAIITARADDVSSLLDLVALEEFTYLSLLLMLAILGPGRASVDAWLLQRFSSNDKVST